jgi:hypothetical protein
MANAKSGRKRPIRASGRKRAAGKGRGKAAGKGRRLELGLIGFDLGREPSRVRPGALIPLMAVALLAALTLASLRIDLLRIRYSVAENIDREQVLQAEQRSLTAEMRKLRDPVTLTRRADELGFVRPERMIDLPGTEAEDSDPGDRGPKAEPSLMREAAAMLADAGSSTLRSWVREP